MFKELSVASDSQAKHFVWKGLGTEVMPLRDQSGGNSLNSQSQDVEATSFHPCLEIQPNARIHLISSSFLADATIQMDPEDIMLR